MEIKIDIQELDSVIKRCKKGVIIGHYNPDGDAVGSITAMYHYLKTRDIEAKIVLPNDFPEYLNYMSPKESPIQVFFHNQEEVKEVINQADTLFCLDFNRLSRTEWMADLIKSSSATKILIDHHPFPEKESFHLTYSKTDISSASELLFWVLMNMPEIAGDPKNLPIKCAESLYSGMMTDTNNFANSVFPSTLQMASMLIESGVDRDQLYDNVYNFYSEQRMNLMGHLLKDCLKVLPQQGAAYLLLSSEDKKKYNFSSGDSEGFVNLPLSIKGVKVSALFSENSNCDTPHIRVSLRSKGDFLDVNDFSSKYFNGGGHKNASGGRLYIPWSEVGTYFEESLKEYLLSLQDVS